MRSAKNRSAGAFDIAHLTSKGTIYYFAQKVHFEGA